MYYCYLISMYTEKDINNMKCFVFRIAQRKWGKDSKELSKIFIDNKLFDCIDKNYDYMHLMSYDKVVDELSIYLKEHKGIEVYK